jgi:hypothetical protein
MSFTWLNKQGVRSDTGFEFQFTGRFSAEYREGDRVLLIPVEGGLGVISIYEGSLQSAFTHPGSSEARRRIAENIGAALRFQGLDLELLPGLPNAD